MRVSPQAGQAAASFPPKQIPHFNKPFSSRLPSLSCTPTIQSDPIRSRAARVGRRLTTKRSLRHAVQQRGRNTPAILHAISHAIISLFGALFFGALFAIFSTARAVCAAAAAMAGPGKGSPLVQRNIMSFFGKAQSAQQPTLTEKADVKEKAPLPSSSPRRTSPRKHASSSSGMPMTPTSQSASGSSRRSEGDGVDHDEHDDEEKEIMQSGRARKRINYVESDDDDSPAVKRSAATSKRSTASRGAAKKRGRQDDDEDYDGTHWPAIGSRR